jgi:hypothetical protein
LEPLKTVFAIYCRGLVDMHQFRPGPRLAFTIVVIIALDQVGKIGIVVGVVGFEDRFPDLHFDLTFLS